ncbi:MAG: hypothetical protein HRT90_00575, partial [Candidatus Margulisbacteria bacterium]|nr:hypothetical protein [Candidatus Margulisiibacteriota bacterium]
MSLEPIAIVGIGLRFPGASTPEDFWQLLKKGKDCISDRPNTRSSFESYID